MSLFKRDLKSRITAEVPYLRRFACALTNDPVFADDLVQDCIERSLTRLHLFDETRSLRTWLFTILRNLYINSLRQRGRRGPHMSLEDISEHNLAQAPNQSASVVGIDIARALDELPQEQREVLVLVALEEMTYEETANIVDAPIGTVMSRLSRARARLKMILDYGEARKRQAK